MAKKRSVKVYGQSGYKYSEDYGLPGSTCPDFGKHDSV